MRTDSSAPRPGDLDIFRHLKNDLPAGTVVFLVALPLCLGIALASGVPLLAGLVSGIVGGLVIAWLSGSQLSVSGPAAGLVVIVVDAIAALGSFEAFLVAVVLAGVLQLLLGVLRAGNLGSCFPSSVIKGMLAAIGITLIMKQLPVAFGFASAKEALTRVPQDVQAIDAWQAALGAITEDALIVALVSLVILFVWETARIKRLPVLGKVPAPLIVVLWGVAYHALMVTADPAAALAEHQRVTLPEVDSLGSLFGQLRSPDWSALAKPELYMTAVSLAIVASLETLLSVEAADKLDPLKRVSSPNRELQAQGVGNVVAGLLGGLPITAVIVRSSANIQAGARTRLSSVVHGVLLLLSVLFLAQVLHWLPLAALAAILLQTGFKLAKPTLFVAAWKQGPAGWVPFVVTIAAILATDLLIGIFIGLICSMLFVINANMRGALSLTSHDGAYLLRLNKDVSFFSKSRLRRYLDQVEPGSELVVDGSRCHFIDRDILEVLDDFVAHAGPRGIKVELRAMPGPGEPGVQAAAAPGSAPVSTAALPSAAG
ncbi:SulP family inorganic anion transporter [Aquabacterium sp. A7-Y]|uniref:SulP family inorganic anion transporter n=1 Tax=Aquabacterium sp. A7-Y TaxID=1349605 RepID=UPI00223CF2D7|nr:SulP family inorganic anion transporter [Aquabacterium sp. A7-Y]MCW7538242.1 SulP family inorganic anion transporter [Aquabacterium sp. A7-Y]